MNGAWIDRFPSLNKLPEQVRKRLEAESRIVALPEGTRIFGSGQSPANFLLLLDGSIRVQQVSESGREIILYRVSAGESCALTTACLMGHDHYQGEGIAETPIEAVAIPRDTFDDLIATSPDFPPVRVQRVQRADHRPVPGHRRNRFLAHGRAAGAKAPAAQERERARSRRRTSNSPSSLARRARWSAGS